MLGLAACNDGTFGPVENNLIPQLGPSLIDESIVRGIALVSVSSDQTSSIVKLFKEIFFLKSATASTGTTTVTYNNAPSVTFTLNTATLTGGAFTGNILSMGAVTVSALKDNNLKLCGGGGNQKCTTAILRVYTTGSVAGFVNTSDSPQYGVPVFVSGLNPATALVIGSPGVNVDQVTGIPSSKHTIQLSDFAPTTYNVTSDFSNAGSGTFQMTFVVEYALAP